VIDHGFWNLNRAGSPAMNAPLQTHELNALGGELRAFAFFHLNLAFSSIEEEKRGEVITRCYWPLLNLAERHVIGMEISGFTLEEIAARDPNWIALARELIEQGCIELIGSGYSQMIGPLVPGRVNAENLKLGNAIYRDLLGVQPTIALVNEQTYSAGLVGHYLDAGYTAILMDWDNPVANHPEWDRGHQYLPQYALGADGRKIAVLWTNTAAFQQLQRFAHDDIPLDTYLHFLRERRGADARMLCIYASDAEIFDFRPGRFKTEEKLSAEPVEWARLEAVFATISAEPGMALVKPSQALAMIGHHGGGNVLRLESAACPVPVKKQRKYNLGRWAVTGRDNIAINAACQRIYNGMLIGAPKPADWKELCYLWASDFRTHLTPKRWDGLKARLEAAEAKWSAPLPSFVTLSGASVTERHIAIETPALRATLDRRRGLAIHQLHFKRQALPSVGGLPHGFFDEIALQADWYTGDFVFELPGEHKLTDLDWVETNLETISDGGVIVQGRLETPRGPVTKRLHFHGDAPQVDFDIAFAWEQWPAGSLRLGHFTLLPDAFDLEALSFATTNGGGPENFALDAPVDHGAPVSLLVTSSMGLGMTEGWLDIGDGKTRLRIAVDRTCTPLLGMITHRRAKRNGGMDSIFCQVQLSAAELDDTRKPASYREGSRRFRFSLSAEPP
jgi:hypothetical protein